MKENIENSRKRLEVSGWDKAANIFLKTYSKAIKGYNNSENVNVLKARMQIYETFRNKLFDEQVQALQNSYSWKVTAPLRAVCDFFKK